MSCFQSTIKLELPILDCYHFSNTNVSLSAAHRTVGGWTESKSSFEQLVLNEKLTGHSGTAAGLKQCAYSLNLIFMIHLCPPLTSESEEIQWKSESHGIQTVELIFSVFLKTLLNYELCLNPNLWCIIRLQIFSSTTKFLKKTKKPKNI